MDSVTTGLSILDGRTTRVVTTSSGLVFLQDLSGRRGTGASGRTTRVVTTNNGLVLLEDLSGSGPQGPPGPEGPPGTVDTSQLDTMTQNKRAAGL